MRTNPLIALLGLSCAATAPRYRVNIPELHSTLDNGIQVIVLPDTTFDLVEVDVRYAVGSNEDPDGKAGLAHLVEHMMFQQRPAGEDKPPLFAVLRQVALYFNAYTNWDTTHYQTLASKDRFEDLVSLEATRLYTGCKTIPQDEFEREREVVRNEMRWRVGTPERALSYQLLTDVYGKDHPYGREIGGDDAQVASITMEDVCKFMEDYYVPERATFIIAGNVTQERAEEVVGKWLAALPARKAAPRRAVPPVKLAHKRIEHEWEVEETTVFVAWALPRDYTVDGQAAQFGTGAIVGRTAGFDFEYEFASGFGGEMLGGPPAQVFAMQMSLKDAGKVDEALDFVWKSARSAHRPYKEEFGFEVDEGVGFEGRRRRQMANFVMAFEQLPARTNLYGDYAQFDEAGEFFGGELKRIRELTPDHAGEVIRRTFDPDKALVIVVKPKAGQGRYKRSNVKYNPSEGSREEFAIDPAEAMSKLQVPQRTTSLTKARRFQLGNGMDVVLLPLDTSLPIVHANLEFAAGSAHEAPSKAGIADFAAAGLFVPEAEAVSVAGVQLRGRAGQDATIFTARALNLYLEEVLKGLERHIKVGDYDQEGIEADQRIFKMAMSRKSVRSRYDAARETARALFGDKHPYATTGIPTVETYGHIGRDAAYDFKSDHFTAKNATLIVTGNFDDKAAEGIIRDNFGDWSGGHQDKPITMPAADRSAPVYVAVDSETSATADVDISYPGPIGYDDKYAARMILAEVLNHRAGAIREELGSSYGVRAGYDSAVGPGAYSMSGPIDGERLGESLIAMRKAFDSLREGKDLAEDFVRARRLLVERWLTRAGDTATLATQLATIAINSLPADYYDRAIQDLGAVTPQQVFELIAAELKPEREVIVIRGPKEVVKKGFADAGISNVRIVE